VAAFYADCSSSSGVLRPRGHNKNIFGRMV